MSALRERPTVLRDELELLLRVGALGDEELRAANERGDAASFVRRAALPKLV
jgi:hypothetical protein